MNRMVLKTAGLATALLSMGRPVLAQPAPAYVTMDQGTRWTPEAGRTSTAGIKARG
jgi:hypothetical protein